jgi:hypothetical protein
MSEAKKFTFEVPADLSAMMQAHPEVNWTAVFRDAIRRQARAAEIARQIMEEESDPRVQAVARLVKGRVAGKFHKARGATRAR